MKTRIRFSIAAFLLIAGTPALPGQSANTAAFTGTVTDPSGALVPNVAVTATNLATNQARTVTTGTDGVYRIPLLEPGNYRLQFSVPGFKTSTVASVTLPVTETVEVSRALEVGTQSEQVTIEAAVETLQTASSSLGTTVTGQAITSLPLSNRNFTQVLGMSTGVAVDVTNGSAFGRGSQNMSVNGASPDKNNFQMDGVGINNAAGNNAAGDAGLYTGIAIPNPDAIQEFKIQTSTYDASFGRNPGANVNVITKSGTNQLHGSLFEFFRNEKLNANDFFYNRDSPLSRTQKQVLKQNQFGGSIGGPIRKDKIFFFGSYQGTRQRNGVAAQGITSATLYPVPDNRESADFQRRLGAAMCGFPTRGVAIACDGSNINPVAIALLRVKLPDGSYYIPGSGTNTTAQRLFSIPARFSEDQYIANVDLVATEKHTLQMKYMFTDDPHQFQLSGNLPGRTQTDARGNTSAVLRLTSLLTPIVVNQARISFQRIIQNGSEVVPYTAQQIGVKPLVDITCCNGTTGGTYTQPPPMAITGAFSVGGGLNPSFAPTNQTQYSDQISWTKGTHTFRAGYEFENVRYPLVFGGLGRGWLFVNSFPDLLIGRRGCTAVEVANGCSVANPGNTTGLSTSSFNNCLFCVRSGVNGIIHNYHLQNQSAFFQDDWKVSQTLTLNLGVRWERNGVLADKYGNLTNFWLSDLASVPVPPSAASQTDPRAFTGYVVPANYDARSISQGGHGPLPPGVRQFGGEFTATNRIPLSNFGPRIGFAWNPTTRLVIRGGAGIFYDRIGINRLVHAVQEGRPYADTTALQHDIASLQSPYQDRPLALLPRWYNFTTLTGSNFNSPFYDHIQTPLVRQYNLGFQYQIMNDYVAEVAYVGSSGINLGDYNHVVNTARLASASNPINGITTNTPANASARVPYLGFLPNGLQNNGFDGVANYNSLQATVRKNFSNGLGFQVAYTWSKNLTTIGFDAANLNNPTDMGQQYGPAPFSRPHRLVIAYQYDLPFKASGVLDRVVRGWSVSGVTTIQSGNPLTLFDGRGGTAYGMPSSGTIENGLNRAQLCPGYSYDQVATSGSVKDRLGLVGNTSAQRFFNTAAFCAPTTLPGGGTDFGNAGVGIVRGPGQANFDFTAGKTTQIGEGKTVQFRADFFNLFNHAQFAIPTGGGNPNNQTLYASNPALFGVITSTSVNPRLIQLALRFQF
jgi:outer membrane receptor protein involved in Fe transport